ncbi:MAG: outer membrane protein assembly factor [Gammaproteobacteria bacterium]|nr:outer membrane protein assembly factor [Gammaproteobacteria bacterium]
MTVTAAFRHRVAAILVLAVCLLGTATVRASVDIVIEGVNEALRKRILAQLNLALERDDAALREPRLRLLHLRAPEEIVAILRSAGYYRAAVSGDLERSGDRWRASYRIERGEPVLMADVVVAVDGDDEVLHARTAAFRMGPGTRLRHPVYENDKKALLRLANQRGYFDARFVEHEILVDLERNRADLRLRLDPGPRYRFGAIEVADIWLDADLIQRLIPFAAGEPYDAAKLIGVQRTLQDSDYFSQVEVLPRRDEVVDLQVPIRIDLTLQARNRYQVGAGFGTDSGPRLSLQWDNRYINRAGHRLGAALSVARIRQALSGGYTIPFVQGPKTSLGFTATLAHDDTETSVADSAQFGMQRLGKRWIFDENASLSYLYEDFTIGGTQARTGLLLPAISWSLLRRDDEVYPRRGYRIGFGIKGALDGVLSDLSVVQARLSGKFIRPLGVGRLLARAEFGAMHTTEFDRVPVSVRFLAGGDNSVRGFDYQALGPTRAGEVIGGRYLAVGSIEYERPIKGDWGAAVFSDVGNAFSSFNDAFAVGAGAGLRWRSRVGMLRVDLAYGRVGHKDSIRLHLTIGPDL